MRVRLGYSIAVLLFLAGCGLSGTPVSQEERAAAARLTARAGLTGATSVPAVASPPIATPAGRRPTPTPPPLGLGQPSDAPQGVGATVSALQCPDAPGPLQGDLAFSAIGNLVVLTSPVVLSGTAQITTALRLVPTKLTDLPPDQWAHDPAWSPDGNTLAYTLAGPSSDPELPWLQVGIICGLDRATGKGRTLVAQPALNDLMDEAAWTPDGTALLVTWMQTLLDADKNFQGNAFSVTRYDLATTQTTRLVQDATSGTLSPDGTRLLFLRYDLQTSLSTLMLANADGSAAQPLTLPDTDWGSIFAPRWSPDGSEISFTATSGPGVATPTPLGQRLWDWLAGVEIAQAHGFPSDIWIANPDTKALRRVTPNSLDDPRAVWGPQNTLAYTGGGNGGVFVFDLQKQIILDLTKHGDYGGIAWKFNAE